MRKTRIEFELNGKPTSAEVYPMARLLDVLREDLKFTGTKEGCGEGECGACSVFIDGKLVNSCLIPVLQAQGAKVETIESESPLLQRVQKSFLENGGAQCGICTPGMILAAVQLLQRNPKPDLDQVREGLAGNLCRCTGYTKIFEAVLRAAE